MINAFQSLVEYKEDEWSDYLDSILLLGIFGDVVEAYPNKETLKTVIRYIAYTYSVDSDRVIIGMDWEDNKKEIFESIFAKPEKSLFDQLVHLQHPSVTKTVHKWLEHQNSSVFKELQSLKDLKMEMQLSCNSKILKSTGEVDYTQKFLNAGYVKEISKMIKSLEEELIQNNPKLKEAVKEVAKSNGDKNSRSVGSYAVN